MAAPAGSSLLLATTLMSIRIGAPAVGVAGLRLALVSGLAVRPCRCRGFTGDDSSPGSASRHPGRVASARQRASVRHHRGAPSPPLVFYLGGAPCWRLSGVGPRICRTRPHRLVALGRIWRASHGHAPNHGSRARSPECLGRLWRYPVSVPKTFSIAPLTSSNIGISSKPPTFRSSNERTPPSSGVANMHAITIGGVDIRKHQKP
jgi:hypothetical protein